MVSIVVATHGHLAESLLEAAAMLLGEEKNIWAIGFFPGDSTEHLLLQFQNILNKFENEDILILTDILGGSPFNTAARLAIENSHIEVISGINLPILLDIIQNRTDMNLNTLVSHVINISADTITTLSKNINHNQNDLQEEEL